MPTLSRLLTGYPKRSIRRIGVCSVVLPSLVTAMVTWRGSPVAVLLPVALSAVAIIFFTMARRALRAASTTIEKILREELEVHGAHVDNGAYAEDNVNRNNEVISPTFSSIGPVKMGEYERGLTMVPISREPVVT